MNVAGVMTHQVRLNVLIAEDDDLAREALVKTVRLLGYPCRGARDGQEAWEMHLREHADVIVSDWGMPRMDGLELCRRTRSFPAQAPYTYFIFMTRSADKEHFVRGMEAGADDYHTTGLDIDELRARLVSAGRVVALHRKLAAQNAVLRRNSQRVLRVARTDSLTQIPNRFSMDEDLKAFWSRAARYGHRFSLAICDVDQFKAYNDHFGHLAGDAALRRVAEVVRERLREGDGLYRYGGEEFVAVLPEQGLADAVGVLERVRAGVERMAIPGRGDHPIVTISCGVAELDLSTDQSPEDCLRRADAALYRAKAAGRNLVYADDP